MINITVKGLEELTAKLDAMTNPTKLQQALVQGALLVESDAKLSIMHGSGGGRTYHRGNITHTASAPGEPPAVDTGALASSISHEAADDGLTITVGSPLDYATYLEYGTRKMGARPFLNPAYEKNREDIIQLIHDAVNS